MKIKNFKRKFISNLIDFTIIFLGAIITAYSLDIFLIPNSMIDGGITGISMMLSQITNIKLGILILAINLPFLALGWKNNGKIFLAKTLYAMIIFSLLLSYFNGFNEITDDMLLASAFGGILLGLGTGLIIHHGGCLDGTEVIAILLSKKSSMSVGQVVLFFNMIIYSVSSFLYGWDRALYSLLTYFITFKIIDLIDDGLNQAKAVMIITDKSETISENIYRKLGRTVTFLDGEGFVSGQKVILYCVITRVEVSDLKKIVEDDDNSAFVTISDVSEIVGNHIKKNKNGKIPENLINKII